MDREDDALMADGYRTMSASDLVARMTCSDVAALGELYDRTSGLAYRFAHGLTGDPAAAASVVEAAYLDAWRAARNGVDGTSVAGWILRLVEQRVHAPA